MIREVTYLLACALMGCEPAYAQSWPDNRGDMHGVVSGGGVNVQSFAGGAGSYTWTKPSGVTFVLVNVIAAGNGGGSGGYSTSLGGGSSGAPGCLLPSLFLASQMTSNVTVTLGAGGAGGSRVHVAGNGSDGGLAGSTSFGSFSVATPSTILAGHAGINGINAAPNGSSAGYTTILSQFFRSSGNGATGKSTAAGTPGGNNQFSVTTAVPYDYSNILLPTPGGGGGGAGSGSSAGGASGAQNEGDTGTVIVSGVAGGSTDGANGTNGTNGITSGFLGTGGNAVWAGGIGGGGGAGGFAASVDGGNGGNGGNCGGSGGGGGGSLSGALGSGAGGNGGDGCVFVISW